MRTSEPHERSVSKIQLRNTRCKRKKRVCIEKVTDGSGRDSMTIYAQAVLGISARIPKRHGYQGPASR